MSALALSAFGSLFVLGLMDNLRGPFYPEILGEFSVSSTKGSLFFAIVSAFAFLGSFLSHRWVQRHSSLYVLIVSSMGFSVGFVAIALSPTWNILCAACAVFGLAFGGLNLSQNTLVLESSPPHARRRMLNGLHSMYALAALVAPLTASLFRLMGLSWRMSFLILALLPWVLLALIGHFVKRPSVEKVKTFSLPLYPKEWKVVFLYALMMASYLWGEIGVTTRMVLWLRTDLDYGPNAANFVMGAFFALFLGGRLVFSVVHFPSWSNWDVMVRSSGLSAIFLVMGLAVHPVFLVLSGLTMAPFFPVAMDQINTHFGEKSSQALGFIIGFGSLSVVAMHVMIGWTTDVWGLTQSLYLCGGGLALVFLALMARSRFDSAR